MFQYKDTDLLTPPKTALILRAHKIVEQFGSIRFFKNYFNLHGETNGKLVLCFEKSDFSDALPEFADDTLFSYGFQLFTDYIFISEGMPTFLREDKITTADKGYHNLMKFNWLQSIISNKVTYMWYNEPSLSTDYKNTIFKLMQYLATIDDCILLDPRLLSIDNDNAYFTLRGKHQIYSLPLKVLFQSEKKVEGITVATKKFIYE